MDFWVADTLRIIFSKLDQTNLRRSRSVCKQWRDLIEISEFNVGALHFDELPLVISVLERHSKLVNIQFKNLERMHPEHLQQLTRLKRLKYFSGSIRGHEDFLSALTDLESLKTDTISTAVFNMLPKLTKLSCNEITGTLTEQVTRLEHLEILEDTDLSFNFFPNLKSLTSGNHKFARFELNQLESLVLTKGVIFDTYPTTLTRLDIPNLEFATHFQVNTFYGTISKLTKLKHMNPSSTISHIVTEFPLLEKCDNMILDGPANWEDLRKMSHLTSIQVNLDYLTLEENISKLSALLELDINRSNYNGYFSRSFFDSLVNLTKLVFDNRCFEDNKASLNYASLTKMTALRHLEIKGFITESFANDLTTLTSLQLSLDNKLTNQKKHCFTKLTDLKSLHLECLELSTCVEDFGALTQLTHLEFRGVINDDDWNQIIKLTNLRVYSEDVSFDTKRDRLADLTAMKNLTSLAILDIEDIANLEHLTALTRLQHLEVWTLEGEAETVPQVRQQLPFLKDVITQ